MNSRPRQERHWCARQSVRRYSRPCWLNRGESRETPDMAALREQADVQQTVATMVQDITTVHRIIVALGNSA